MEQVVVQDTKLDALADRVERLEDKLEQKLGELAAAMQQLARDMHQLTVFAHRVESLERAAEKFGDSFRRVHERIDTMNSRVSAQDANSASGNVKLGVIERAFWIAVVAVVGVIAHQFER